MCASFVPLLSLHMSTQCLMYMKGLHEVVHRDEQAQAQGFMGLRQQKLS